ncbi:MAG: hypothetical protein ACK5ZJ_08600, partial [Acidobacteriota bacterium]
EQLGYLAGRRDSIQEGERTLLGNSMILFCSSMLTGNHEARQLPVVMLGGGGGRLRGGRVLDYREKPERQMCRLYLSVLDKMGLRPPRFGDATQPLDEV